MTAEIGPALQPLPHKPSFKLHKKIIKIKKKKKQSKMRPNVITRGGKADWILKTNMHLCSELHLHKAVRRFSCSQNHFPPSSITAKPYLIHFKQWCLLWWISNVRELGKLLSGLGSFLWLANHPHTPSTEPSLQLSISINCALASEYFLRWMKWNSCHQNTCISPFGKRGDHGLDMGTEWSLLQWDWILFLRSCPLARK